MKLVVSLSVVALATFALPACFLLDKKDGTTGTGGEASTSSSTASSTGTGKGCDAQSSCEACTTCATKSQCADEVSACENNSSCVGLDECLGLCGATQDCRAQCEAQNLPGVADYNAAIVCLFCDACPNTCAGSANCQ